MGTQKDAVPRAPPTSDRLATRRSFRRREPMNDQQRTTITAVVHRAPEWIRQDLVSKDQAARQRAEDALAAMIAAALGSDKDASHGAANRLASAPD